MKIGIVGSRRRNTQEDFRLVREAFFRWSYKDTIIISGGCLTGADSFAEQIASKCEVPILVHRAKWEEYGKAAGPIRNTKIAEDSDILIACVAPDRTGGTEDTIRKFVKLKGDKNLHLV